MRTINVINKDSIKLNLNVDTASEVITELGSMLEKQGYVKDSYIENVLAREKVFPTGLQCKGFCVAIPHTDVNHVNKSAVAVGILGNTVKFAMMGDANTELDVSIVMMLAVDSPDSQIELLKNLMSIFQNEELLMALKEAKNEEEIYNLLSFLND